MSDKDVPLFSFQAGQPHIKPGRRTNMTLDALFPVSQATRTKTIRFKQIRAIYETLHVSEPITTYLQPNQRYTAPAQVYGTFKFLMQETKEMFLTAHLDGKNRLIALVTL
jgi:DNA repair protein RadC